MFSGFILRFMKRFGYGETWPGKSRRHCADIAQTCLLITPAAMAWKSCRGLYVSPVCRLVTLNFHSGLRLLACCTHSNSRRRDLSVCPWHGDLDDPETKQIQGLNWKQKALDPFVEWRKAEEEHERTSGCYCIKWLKIPSELESVSWRLGNSAVKDTST